MKNLSLALSLLLSSLLLYAGQTVDGINSSTNHSSVEELRIDRARSAIPAVVDRWNCEVNSFSQAWIRVNSFDRARSSVIGMGNCLWSESKAAIACYDNRPVYWTRLGISQILGTQSPSFEVAGQQRDVLLELFEDHSRGHYDLKFVSDAPLKNILTGFDPFLLNKNIKQGNPSGIAVLMLGGKVIEFKSKRAELAGQTSVYRSGGGYLSNEISFRSIRLRDQLNSTVATGHIHTPVLIAKPIVDQLQNMLKHALVAI